MTWQADMDVINSNPKLAGIDLEKILTPASELRPGAAQRCIMKQVRSPVAEFISIAPHMLFPWVRNILAASAGCEKASWSTANAHDGAS